MSLSDIIASARNAYTQGYQQVFAYDVSSRVEYLGVAQRGHATSDAVWWIFNFSYDASSNVTAIKMAPKGSIWDNRATLSYA